jgi:hypothetical protein
MSELVAFEEVFLGVRDWMLAKGLPKGWLEYGPPRVPEKVGGSRLYMCPDAEAGDGVLPARSQKMNPTLIAVCALGIRFVIFAHDTRQGAQLYHHADLALRIANLAHVALMRMADRAFVRLGGELTGRTTTARVTARGFVADATTDAWSGCVYLIRAQVDTPVSDVTFKGAAAAEAEFTTGTTSLDVDGPATNADLPQATTRVL